MDDASRQTLQMKFVKLAMILNGVLLFAAIAVIALAGIIPFYQVPIAAVFGTASVVLAILFLRSYRRDKQWLDTVPDDAPKGTTGEQGAAGGVKGAEPEE